MSSLEKVNDTLIQNNKTLNEVSSTLSSMLMEDIKRRQEEERSRKDIEESENEAKRKIRGSVSTSSNKSAKTASGQFAQGLFGDKIYDLASSALSGVFGGIGAVSLAKIAGKGLRYGAAAFALNKLAQGAIDNLFENIDPNELGVKDPEKFKEDVSKGVNTGIALKFLGFSKFASLGGAIGQAFGDDMANALKTWADGNILNAPNPLKIFGIGPESFPVNLDNPVVQEALGASVGMIAASLLRVVARGLVGRLAILGLAGGAALFSKLGLTKLADLLDKYKDAKPSAPPLGDFEGPGQPKPPSLEYDKPKPIKLTDAVQDVLKNVQKGNMVIEGLRFAGEGADARPQIFDDTKGRWKFASNEELTKLAKTATNVTEETSKALKALKVTGKVATKLAVPVGVTIDAYSASIDEEAKQFGLSFGQRMNLSAVTGMAGLMDLVNNYTNEALNYALGTDFKTDYNLSSQVRNFTLEQNRAYAEYMGLNPPQLPQQPIIVNIDQSDKSSTSTSTGSRSQVNAQTQFGSAVDMSYLEKMAMQQGVKFGQGPWGY